MWAYVPDELGMDTKTSVMMRNNFRKAYDAEAAREGLQNDVAGSMT